MLHCSYRPDQKSGSLAYIYGHVDEAGPVGEQSYFSLSWAGNRKVCPGQMAPTESTLKLPGCGKAWLAGCSLLKKEAGIWGLGVWALGAGYWGWQEYMPVSSGPAVQLQHQQAVWPSRPFFLRSESRSRSSSCQLFCHLQEPLPWFLLGDLAYASGYIQVVEKMLTILFRQDRRELVTSMDQGSRKHSPSNALPVQLHWVTVSMHTQRFLPLLPGMTPFPFSCT